MAAPLPPLRRTLELMPSPVRESPGLLVRDPFRYVDGLIILPPPLVSCLLLFDGAHDEADLRTALVALAGEGDVDALARHLVDTLSQGGFLEDAAFAARRDRKHRDFAEETARLAVHGGAAYPADPAALTALLARYLAEAPKAPPFAGEITGIAAPHVSPEGGWRSYGAAYALLPPADRERTFVILGTSHYGEPERFGVTHKPFRTPLGETSVDHELVSRVAEAGGSAVELEDYCHAVEHSIEFQVVFLQHLYGPAVRIAPILCGPFARATYRGGFPEDDDGVRRVLDALRALGGERPDDLFWIAGVDMAHVGRRYGDRLEAHANEGPLCEVAHLDRTRCDRLAAGDAAGFWSLLRQNQDPLRWCGASALYTLVAAATPAAGHLLHYEQWNIDARSVVSCAGLAFTR
jgi:MEMO1 family protein